MERGCPMFAAAFDPCAICGNHIFDQKVWYLDDAKTFQICAQCNAAMRNQPCQVCENISYCAFQQDTSCSLPPIITVQQRQGNAVIQMQQKNPERIKETCEKGCKCYFNGMCMRELGDCGNQKIDWNRLIK